MEKQGRGTQWSTGLHPPGAWHGISEEYHQHIPLHPLGCRCPRHFVSEDSDSLIKLTCFRGTSQHFKTYKCFLYRTQKTATWLRSFPSRAKSEHPSCPHCSTMVHQWLRHSGLIPVSRGWAALCSSMQCAGLPPHTGEGSPSGERGSFTYPTVYSTERALCTVHSQKYCKCLQDPRVSIGMCDLL